MPFVPLPETAKVVMSFSRDTREFQNVLYARRTGGWNLVQLADLANTAIAWWNDLYRLAAGQQVCLRQVTATDVSVQFGAQFVAPVVPQICGNIVGNALPGSATATISWRTGFTGRRNRGRLYAVGLMENDVLDIDTLLGTLVTALSVAGAGWITRVLALGATPVVASLTYGATQTIISAVVENILDSQRRRLPKRGR